MTIKSKPEAHLFNMRILLFLTFLIVALHARAQESYLDSLTIFRNDYIAKHEVVRGEEKKALSFFPLQTEARVMARFETAKEMKWISMETSSGSKKTFRIYGYAHFTWDGKPGKLTIYQPRDLMASEAFKDYLFVPFADESNEDSSYEIGRYIDLRTGDIVNNILLIDFNKAYNPYCAYVSGKYNCPVPLKENFLPFRIDAGEKRFRNR